MDAVLEPEAVEAPQSVTDDVVFHGSPVNEEPEAPLSPSEQIKNLLRKVPVGERSAIDNLDAGIHMQSKLKTTVQPGKGLADQFLGKKVKDVDIPAFDTTAVLYVANQGDWKMSHKSSEMTKLSIVSGGKAAVAPREANEQAAAQLARELGFYS